MPRVPPQDDAHREPNTGRTTRQKLGIYLIGVSIGLMFYGWTQARKNMATKRQPVQHATQADPQPDPHAADPLAQPTNEPSTTTEDNPG